jgi:hypothetical protein
MTRSPQTPANCSSLRSSMTEAQLLAAVRLLGQRTGWALTYHTYDSRRSEPGWPDLVLLHPRRRRVVFAELKREGEHPTADQQAWLDGLASCGLEVACWRPTDLDDEIPAVLTGYRRLDDPANLRTDPSARTRAR